MPDIFQDFPINAPIDRVYAAVTTPQGLDAWWTKRSSGEPVENTEYVLWFGADYDWRGRVTKAVRNSRFELELTRAMDDWVGSRVGFELEPRGEATWVRFHHTGWPDASEHYRVSSHCWAMYLRVMRRWLEHDEFVPYEIRLEV